MNFLRKLATSSIRAYYEPIMYTKKVVAVEKKIDIDQPIPLEEISPRELFPKIKMSLKISHGFSTFKLVPFLMIIHRKHDSNVRNAGKCQWNFIFWTKR